MKTIEFQTNIENGIITIPKQFELSNKHVKIAIFENDLAEKDFLHIEIDNQLKNFFTISAIQNYVEQQLQFLLMDQIKTALDKQIASSGIDNEILLEKAREQAWDNYKSYFLKGIKTE
ncbi:MAG TPA: hypothetical protein DCQ31_07865 [Bacteroidales bacterium]|nr:hypothetical protein [Bacteroidales bacterium]